MSAQLTVTAQRGPWLKRIVSEHPVPAFYALALGFTWPFLIADALGSWGLVPFRLATSGPGLFVTILMGYGPTFAALLVAGILGGMAGMGKLLGRLFIWRVGLQWYAVAALGPVLLFWTAIQLYGLLGGTARSLPHIGLPALVLNMLLLFLVQGVINGEEIGWRGFALPRLQAKQNALVASLGLGLVWALFHLPIFFTQGGGAGGNMSANPLPAFVIQVLAASILVAWVFNNTRGSLLPALFFHASVNSASQLFASATPDTRLFWLQAGVFCAAAVLVVVWFGASNLSRTRERIKE